MASSNEKVICFPYFHNPQQVRGAICWIFGGIDELPFGLQYHHIHFNEQKHNLPPFKLPSMASPHIGLGLVAENQHILSHFCYLYGIPSIEWVYEKKVSPEGWYLLQLLMILKKNEI